MKHLPMLSAALVVSCAIQNGVAADADPCGVGPLTHAEDLAPAPAFANQTRAPAPAKPSKYQVRVLASGLNHPWSLALLPEHGKFLVTDRQAQLHVVDGNTGTVSQALSGLPPIVPTLATGLYGVLLDPEFEKNRRLILSYIAPPADGRTVGKDDLDRWLSAPAGQRLAGMIGFERVATARLAADMRSVEDFRVVFEGGSRRMAWAADGTLMVTQPTPAGPINADMEPQLLTSDYGKVLRIRPDGSIPTDNPFAGRPGIRPEIYAHGFRDVQGVALNPRTNEIWTSEHGPRGGDEINVVRPGHNYGYPLITYGREYSGALISGGKSAQDGLDQPVYFWVPDIGPSGIAFYDATMFPEWRLSLLVASLAGRRLTRLQLDGDRVISEESLLHERCKRIRDVQVDREGAVYLITDEDDGELLKLSR